MAEKDYVVLTLDKYDKLRDDLRSTQLALNDEMEENARLNEQITKLQEYIIDRMLSDNNYYIETSNSVEDIVDTSYPGKFIRDLAEKFNINIEFVKSAFQKAINDYKNETKKE